MSAVAAQWPPDYVPEFTTRINRLRKLRKSGNWLGAKEYYRSRGAEGCIEFIEHWCVTVDPRNAGSDTPTTMPFLLFPKQKDLVRFLFACIEAQADGLDEKCRDMGATWVCCAVSVYLWLFWEGSSVGWGSRKEQLVDKLGDMDSIFEKIRALLRNLPREFLPAGYSQRDHATFMKFVNPANGASITGEAGDNIGRGGRKLIYFKDESAHYERPELIEASLGDNTNVQIDISSVNGLGNVFHRKREAGVLWAPGQAAQKGKINVFVMEWQDHPAKTQEWYELRRGKAIDLGLLHKFEQEVNRNYAASVSGTIIPIEWIQAARDAHLKLGIAPSGRWGAALDVADNEDGQGGRNALAKRHGIILRSAEDWALPDVGATTRKALADSTGLGLVELQYDSIGMGSSVKAEANRLTSENLMPHGVKLIGWAANAKPLRPKQRVILGDKESPLNGDFYANLKAQGWWELRARFERTYRALTEKDYSYDPDSLISLDSTMPNLHQIEKELAQPTFGYNGAIKLMVNKTPEGTRSPNLGDAIMMCYWPVPANENVPAMFGVYGAAA